MSIFKSIINKPIMSSESSLLFSINKTNNCSDNLLQVENKTSSFVSSYCYSLRYINLPKNS